MSITAHFTEQYILKKHFPALNFRWLIVGSAFPDALVFDRIFMFLIDIRMHRDYFFGYFHTLVVPLMIAFVLWPFFGRIPALCFLIGSWLHVCTDMFDTIGVKLFWPFVDRKISLGIWPWSDTSIAYDLWTYYTTPAGGLFELFFLVWALLIIRKLNGRSIWEKMKVPWTQNRWNENMIQE